MADGTYEDNMNCTDWEIYHRGDDFDPRNDSDWNCYEYQCSWSEQIDNCVQYSCSRQDPYAYMSIYTYEG